MKMYPIYFKMHVIDQGSSTPALKVFPAEFSYNLGQKKVLIFLFRWVWLGREILQDIKSSQCPALFIFQQSVSSVSSMSQYGRKYLLL